MIIHTYDSTYIANNGTKQLYLHSYREVVSEEGFILPDLGHLCLQFLTLQARLLLNLIHLFDQLWPHRHHLLLVVLLQFPVDTNIKILLCSRPKHFKLWVKVVNNSKKHYKAVLENISYLNVPWRFHSGCLCERVLPEIEVICTLNGRVVLIHLSC